MKFTFLERVFLSLCKGQGMVPVVYFCPKTISLWEKWVGLAQPRDTGHQALPGDLLLWVSDPSSSVARGVCCSHTFLHSTRPRLLDREGVEGGWAGRERSPGASTEHALCLPACLPGDG